MSRKTTYTLGLFVLLVPFLPDAHSQAEAQEGPTKQENVGAQEEPKPLDPNDPRLTFSFPIQRGGKPFRFKVELDKTGNMKGVSVYLAGDTTQLQTLPACGTVNLPEPITENWLDYEIAMLVKHADLNFDDFEDLELLQFYIPHLDKKVYCIYLWDKRTGRFSYSVELSKEGVNLEPRPENKTITAHEDWFGGVYADRTYRWIGTKFELIKEDGRHSGSSDPKCSFTDYCEELVNGKKITTLEWPAACVNSVGEDVEDIPLSCPAAATPSVSTTPSDKPAKKKKD